MSLVAINIIVMTIHFTGRFESKALLLGMYKAKANRLIASATTQMGSVARDAYQNEQTEKFKANYEEFVDLASPFIDTVRMVCVFGEPTC